jgi:predicted enzyme related to lactoylglutathione lyase
MDKNVVGWFEVPVTNMERAITFYEAVFGFKMQRFQMPQIDMAWFPYHEEGLGPAGSLVYNEEFYQPKDNGVLIYFTSAAGDVAKELEKVEAAGGQVLVPKTQISEDHGFMGIILDSEGNRIGIHSRK